MRWISERFIKENIHYDELIQALKMAFRANVIQSPPKSVYTYSGIKGAADNTFLFMPAWDNEGVFGVKLLTATPHNRKADLPYIQGMYLFFDAKNGKPLIGMDAKAITNYRTAATSALAALYLAKKRVDSILCIGNGSLAPYFISAHTTVRAYSKVYLWGLRRAPSERVASELQKANIRVEIIEDYKTVSRDVDVITCITSAKSALLEKRDLGTGQHLDLAGSFTPEMHEVSTDVITSCSVYTDNTDATPHHAGELVKATKEGFFSSKDIRGDLAYLCQNDVSKRKNSVENTLFKSTGMALEDLVIAQLIYKKHELSRG